MWLSLESERSPEQLSNLARELAADLRREADLEAQEVSRPPEPGERGAEVGLLGQLALTFLSAGAATALINCLRAYIQRDHTLRFKLKRPDGSELELEGKHLQADKLEETLRALERFVL